MRRFGHRPFGRCQRCSDCGTPTYMTWSGLCRDCRGKWVRAHPEMATVEEKRLFLSDEGKETA